MSTFSEAKERFDATLGVEPTLRASFVPVDGKPGSDLALRNGVGDKLEEYYKWQFLYALIYSGLYAKDYIGTEIRFPKGHKNATPIKLDAAIFDDLAWLEHYNRYWEYRRSEDLEWLNAHLLATVEFKRGEKEIEKVFTGQVKPAMREKDPADAFVLGIYYDRERLFLFQRRSGLYLRYDEAKNEKGDASKIGDLSLDIPDPYSFIPSFAELNARVNRPALTDRSRRGVVDLDVITSIATVQVQSAFSNVLRALDKAGLVNERGYHIIVESLALKIFDEKRNADNPHRYLDFYVTHKEADFIDLKEASTQLFITRIKEIWKEAAGQYRRILSGRAIDWKNPNHIRAIVAVCQAFQDFSFVRSAKSDLYQLIFYNFANEFKRDESAQFLTPLPVIDFLVRIVNPRNGETVIDPCCGIGDFLSLAFVSSLEKVPAWQLRDANIYGVDVDENMVMLATVNMLLNGDGEAKLFLMPDKGSILSKVARENPPKLVNLIPERHSSGNWDDWPDRTELMKFDVVLTNPPFGKDRAYRTRTKSDREIIEMYETWPLAGGGGSIDLGVVFLENAVHCLKAGGRLGMVLSNSIASNDTWKNVREWFMKRMRIVALFDLPPNVFAETGVNTTLIVAYKPAENALKLLNEHGYSVFVRDIKNVGYERRTRQRNVFFNPVFRIDESTFQIEIDRGGTPVLLEDFTAILREFREWTLGQEETLQTLFRRED